METTMKHLTLLLIPISVAAQDLSYLPLLKSYKAERISSFDRGGDNQDGDQKHPIAPGETRVMGDVRGPGIIKHIWIAFPSNENYHLKKYVLRMYWDGESSPAVETPLGDFFGLGLGEYVVYESGPLSVGSQKAMNSFFPMPFRKSARITVTNEGEEPLRAFYFNIDWEKHDRLPDDIAYFYAEYRQSVPNKGWTNDWKLNRDPKVNNKLNPNGEDNYVFFETEGRGHYVGVVLSILQNQGDWWGEDYGHRIRRLFPRRMVLWRMRAIALRRHPSDIFVPAIRQSDQRRRHAWGPLDGIPLPSRFTDSV
jgi:hypothetical protein